MLNLARTFEEKPDVRYGITTMCIGLGMGLGAIPGLRFAPSPLEHPEITERFAEFVVIIALMGAGLKLDRLFSWRRWNVTWRLLGITMPLSIAAIMLIGVTLLGLPWPVALLLGAFRRRRRGVIRAFGAVVIGLAHGWLLRVKTGWNIFTRL